MVPPRSAEPRPGPEAVEFVRFCYRRRAVGWPELYDVMCGVASRGLFRGWGPEDLAEHGVGFGLFELPALAALASEVIAEEQATRTLERRNRGLDARASVHIAAEVTRRDAVPEAIPAAPSAEPRNDDDRSDGDRAERSSVSIRTLALAG